METEESYLGGLKKLWFQITEPHESITGIRKRQQARLLSTLLLVAMPIFFFIQFTSELMVEVPLTYFLASVLAFILYLVSRSRYSKYALAITITGITFIPILIFFFGTPWSSNDLARFMPWIIVALLAGALLARTVVVILQGVFMSLTMAIIVGYVFQRPFFEYDALIGISLVLTLFVAVVSYMLEMYEHQITHHAADLDRQKRELEVYTQLLRHDLRNDLQAVLSSIELATMFLHLDPEKTKENLLQSLGLGERMVELLHVFSMPLEQPGADLVEHIRRVAGEAQETYPHIQIQISCSESTSECDFTASRLLTMVWLNLLRNAAMYAGNAPEVQIDISLEEGYFQVRVRDNGPGIPEEKKDWLFRRGSGFGTDEHGIGLYLSRIVLESHNGTIELVEDTEGKGTEFLIKIPATRKT
ncbi:MAG: putative Sensor histidine kinase DpiB [Candidatus Thorarchaeota archaeon]|nr:MAG: putative Sensor histidine kinase DpiB [Candidatus Thorarchaeota archaeon]